MTAFLDGEKDSALHDNNNNGENARNTKRGVLWKDGMVQELEVAAVMVVDGKVGLRVRSLASRGAGQGRTAGVSWVAYYVPT